MTDQLDLFGEAKVAVAEPEPMTTVRVGSRVTQIPLHKRRREACARLVEILAELEGKDIHIGSYDTGGRHYWLDNLKPLPSLVSPLAAQIEVGLVSPIQAYQRLYPQRHSPLGKPKCPGQDIHQLPGGCPRAGIYGLLALPAGLPQRHLGIPDRQLPLTLRLPNDN